MAMTRQLVHGGEIQKAARVCDTKDRSTPIGEKCSRTDRRGHSSISSFLVTRRNHADDDVVE